MDDQGWGGPPQAAAAGDPFGASQRVLEMRRRQRRWVAGLWVLAVVVVALAAVTVAVSLGRSGTSGSHAANGPARTGTTAVTTSSLPSGNGPVLTSLSPPEGAVGDVVVITGTGLVSPDGQVIAHFGSVGAPTSCASATSCRATVPSPSGGGAKVQVTVTTATGTSNPLAFTYR